MRAPWAQPTPLQSFISEFVLVASHLLPQLRDDLLVVGGQHGGSWRGRLATDGFLWWRHPRGRPLIAPCAPALALSYQRGGVEGLRPRSAGTRERLQQFLGGPQLPWRGPVPKGGPDGAPLLCSALLCPSSWAGPRRWPCRSRQKGSEAAPHQAWGWGEHPAGLRLTVNSSHQHIPWVPQASHSLGLSCQCSCPDMPFSPRQALLGSLSLESGWVPHLPLALLSSSLWHMQPTLSKDRSGHLPSPCCLCFLHAPNASELEPWTTFGASPCR